MNRRIRSRARSRRTPKVRYRSRTRRTRRQKRSKRSSSKKKRTRRRMKGGMRRPPPLAGPAATIPGPAAMGPGDITSDISRALSGPEETKAPVGYLKNTLAASDGNSSFVIPVRYMLWKKGMVWSGYETQRDGTPRDGTLSVDESSRQFSFHSATHPGDNVSTRLYDVELGDGGRRIWLRADREKGLSGAGRVFDRERSPWCAYRLSSGVKYVAPGGVWPRDDTSRGAQRNADRIVKLPAFKICFIPKFEITAAK